jgi:predicted acyl esterase
MARLHGLDQVGFVAKLFNHPAYDAFWQGQAIDKLLVKEPVSVPVMLVHSLWDQEDIYGNIAVYKAIKPLDTDNSKVFLVAGPWFHHPQRLAGSAIGAIQFGSDTAAYFRRHLLRPFLDHFLKDDAPPLAIAPVNATTLTVRGEGQRNPRLVRPVPNEGRHSSCGARRAFVRRAARGAVWFR